jgi:proline iminopeptidase
MLVGALAVAEANSQEYNFINHSDVKIAYRLFGKGRPLIVINGGPGRSSLKKVDEMTIQFSLMVEDLELLRKHLGFSKVSLLGHSFGGMYAMAYASNYPENIEQLILSASGGIDLKSMEQVENNIQARLSKDKLKEYKFWTSRGQKKKDPIKAKLEALRVTASIYVYQQKFIPLIEKNLTNLDYYKPQVNQLVWKSMENEKYNLSGAFANFKVRTLIVDGEQDFLGKEIPTQIKLNFPNSRLEILKQCSHYPWLDRPDEYFSLINSFLDSV